MRNHFNYIYKLCRFVHTIPQYEEYFTHCNFKIPQLNSSFTNRN